MKCKLFGHKWNYYKEIVEQTHSSMVARGGVYGASSTFTILVDTEFRICERCQYKQVREHFTGRDIDWSTAELSKEQLRDKKLKELGI
jgi:hypothetical protein